MDAAMEEPDGPPSEVALMLVFQSLEWRVLLKSVDLVCRRWRRIASRGEIWKHYCDEEMIRFAEYARRIRDALQDYQIMSRELQSETHRSYRDIFIVSHRMGNHFHLHRRSGPDSTSGRGADDQRTLRHALMNDLQCIVLPAVESLRRIFGDPGKPMASTDRALMKERLLDFARKDPRRARMFRHNSPRSLEKEDLASRAGEYFLATATLKSKDFTDYVVKGSTVPRATFGELINGLGRIAGKEITMSMDSFVKVTPQGFDLEFSFKPENDWPISPVDIVHFLIKELWPSKFNLERPRYDPDNPWDEEAAYDEFLKGWWSSLSDQLRKTLITICCRRVASFEDIEDATEIPMQELRFIGQHWIKDDLEKMIWKEMEVNMMDVYLKRARVFLDLMRREYSDIYGNGSNETNAKILLDIFLEVPHHNDSGSYTNMTREYCRDLPARMGAALDRWDELIEAAAEEDQILWSPQTLVELDSLTSKFYLERHVRKKSLRMEFNVEALVGNFLTSALASQSVPEYYSLHRRVEKLVKDLESIVGPDGNYKVPQHEVMRHFEEWTNDGVLTDFVAYRDYAHVREHAMLALIPLLGHLTSDGSKKLVYAVFIENDGRSFGGGSGFSSEHFGDQTFDHDDIPCGSGQDLNSIVPDAFQWVKVCYRGRKFGPHGTLLRLFGLPLPRNILAAMADFLVDRLYQGHGLLGVDFSKWYSATTVLPFLERSVYETPECSHLVWGCLERALQNALAAVEELSDEVIEDRHQRDFTSVIRALLCSCIVTRAVPVVATIREVYEGRSFAIISQAENNLAPLDTLLQRVNEAPVIALNTRHYISDLDEY